MRVYALFLVPLDGGTPQRPKIWQLDAVDDDAAALAEALNMLALSGAHDGAPGLLAIDDGATSTWLAFDPAKIIADHQQRDLVSAAAELGAVKAKLAALVADAKASGAEIPPDVLAADAAIAEVTK